MEFTLSRNCDYAKGGSAQLENHRSVGGYSGKGTRPSIAVAIPSCGLLSDASSIAILPPDQATHGVSALRLFPAKKSQKSDEACVFVTVNAHYGETERLPGRGREIVLAITGQPAAITAQPIWAGCSTARVQQALDKFAVPQLEQEELKAIVEGTRESIVVAPFGADAEIKCGRFAVDHP
jgi:hypothetical protein